MNYKEGREFLESWYEEIGDITFTRLHHERKEVYENIIIEIPGKKRKLDYRMKLINSNQAPTHSYIINMFYDFVSDGEYNAEELMEFLENVYTNGTSNERYNRNPDLDYLQHLIFWITLQEEINYPHGAGKKLAFCRFIEAINAALPNSPFSLQEIVRRSNNHGGPKPALYNNLIIHPEIYHY